MSFHHNSVAVVLAAVAAGVLATSLFAQTPTTAWSEKIGTDEAQQFASFSSQILDIQRQLAGPGNDPSRGFHAKPHGAMSAELTVLPNLPDYLRHGFAKDSKKYKCYVRFSNGVGIFQSDWKPDVRGMAVKLVGVPGTKLLDGDEGASTQDFLTTNQPVSLARNATQFMAFAHGNVHPLTLPFTMAKYIGAREAARIVSVLLTTTTRPVRSVARETFWSGGCIKFGPYAAKFIFKPVGADPSHTLLPGRDGLRNDLRKRLARSDVRFDMYLQFHVDEQRTPIEDSSVEWLEKDAPPVKIAELVIKSRDLTSAAAEKEEEYVNSLAFTPWHCTEDLRPIGHTMRARKAVYRASAQLRRFAPEPKGTEGL